MKGEIYGNRTFQATARSRCGKTGTVLSLNVRCDGGDTFSVLWVEKVKDPLLLGCIDGCKDFFLICEWGDDIKFDDIVKGK